jgi:hypothetical protein
MLYMVIEHFKDPEAVYRRARDQGRLLPDGLRYVSSWVESNFSRCWQLMETDDPQLFDTWIARWQDLADLEVVPVLTSQDAADSIKSRQ